MALQKARQEEQREARLAEVLEQDLTKGLAELREAKKQGTVSPAPGSGFVGWGGGPVAYS